MKGESQQEPPKLDAVRTTVVMIPPAQTASAVLENAVEHDSLSDVDDGLDATTSKLRRFEDGVASLGDIRKPLTYSTLVIGRLLFNLVVFSLMLCSIGF